MQRYAASWRLGLCSSVKKGLSSSAFIFVYCLVSSVALCAPPSPPSQPASGPGGASYVVKNVKKTAYESGNFAYVLFEPEGLKSKAPVVIFVHGWGAINPKGYGAWIAHIVRRGNIVIYPRYQEDLRVSPAIFTANVVQSLALAFRELEKGNHTPPDFDKIAAVGHSIGGVIVANLAAISSSSPQRIKVIMAVEPGKTWSASKRAKISFNDLSKIPSTTLLLSIFGEEDKIVRDIDAEKIYTLSTGIPAKNKNLLLLRSDRHGKPELIAGHFAPAASDPALSDDPGNAGTALGAALRERFKKSGDPSAGNRGSAVDALDYFGTWKLFDALMDAAFFGKNREYALGDTQQQRFMGLWSDGKPVNELKVIR